MSVLPFSFSAVRRRMERSLLPAGVIRRSPLASFPFGNEMPSQAALCVACLGFQACFANVGLRCLKIALKSIIEQLMIPADLIRQQLKIDAPDSFYGEGFSDWLVSQDDPASRHRKRRMIFAIVKSNDPRRHSNVAACTPPSIARKRSSVRPLGTTKDRDTADKCWRSRQDDVTDQNFGILTKVLAKTVLETAVSSRRRWGNDYGLSVWLSLVGCVCRPLHSSETRQYRGRKIFCRGHDNFSSGRPVVIGFDLICVKAAQPAGLAAQAHVLRAGNETNLRSYPLRATAP